MLLRLLCLSIICAGVVGCSATKGGAKTSPEMASPDLTVAPKAPVISSIEYVQGAAVQLLTAPYSGELSLVPDFGTNGCAANQYYLKIKGTYDSAVATSVSVAGVASSTVTLNGSSFQILTCVVSGLSNLSLSSKSAAGVSSIGNLQVALSSTNLGTLANGIRMGAALAGGASSGGLALQQIGIESGVSIEMIASGNSDLTMSVGLSDLIGRENP